MATVDAWANSLREYALGDPVINQDQGVVEINAEGRRAVVVDLAEPPDGATLRVLNAGTRTNDYSVVLRRGLSPDRVVLQPAETLGVLRLGNEAGVFSTVRIEALGSPRTGSTLAVESLGQSPSRIEVSGLSVNFGGGFGPPDAVFLENAVFKHPGLWNQVRELELHNRVVFANALRTERSRVSQGVEIDAQVELDMGGVESGSDPCKFSVIGGIARAHALPSGSAVTLASGASFILSVQPENESDSHDIEFVSFEGRGLVQVMGRLLRPRFSPINGPLVLEAHGQVFDASGHVQLQAHGGSVCTGAPEDPLAATRILEAENAEIEGISLYALEQLADLSEVAKAQRFSPWIPPRQGSARQLEDEMQLGGGPEETVLRKRAYFWSRLSVILSQTHASGGVQSDVRFAAARARQRSIRRARETFFFPGREWFLLWFYSWVGYGERVWAPLRLHLLFSVVVALILVDPLTDWTPFSDWLRNAVGTLVDVLLSPLAFFRLTEKPDAVGLGEDFALLFAQAAGILLLFFALSAIRRVTKAE